MAEDSKRDAAERPVEGAPPDAEALDRQRALGVRLRSLFSDIVEEPVPDDFLDLLDKLDRGGGGEGQDSNGRR
ncbi:MAG: NepR family anti-sigma factor [Hyphomonadaceae bacterium]